MIHSSKIAIRNRPHCFRRHGAVGDQIAILQVQRARVAAALAPAVVGERQHLGGDALDDWNELDELRPDLVAQEAVDLEWMVDVAGVNGRARMLNSTPCACSNRAARMTSSKVGLAALVDAVGVVHAPAARR